MWSNILCEFLVFPFIYDENKPSYKFLNSYHYVILSIFVSHYIHQVQAEKNTTLL